MDQIAFLFSGQGAQKPGMGLSLYQSSKAAKAVFDTLESLRPGLQKLCFEGPMEELTQTRNAQPCLLACELAFDAAARERGLSPDACAGFSLGEWAAAVSSGLLGMENAFRLVLKRAQWMQAAAERHKGGMSAILRLEKNQVENICAKLPSAWPANYNAPGQTVVSATEDCLPHLETLVKEAGGRALRLNVSGAFHCPLMAEAGDKLLSAFENEVFASPALPLYSNVTAEPYGATEAPSLLASQLSSPVRWTDTLQNLYSQGIKQFVEIGPGGVLCGLVSKTLPEARFARVEDAETLENALSLFGGKP